MLGDSTLHGVYISARVDYATRALLVLAAAESDKAIKGEAGATAQGMPVKVVENTLTDLRRAGLVTSHRGSEGGYRLARPASEIAIADVFRALEGPLAEVHGLRPNERSYEGPAEHLQDVWVGVRAALRSVLEATTLADVVSGRLPPHVAELVGDPDAWAVRPLGAAARERQR